MGMFINMNHPLVDLLVLLAKFIRVKRRQVQIIYCDGVN